MSPIRVLVVDDAVVIRRVLGDLLQQDPEIELAGTAINGEVALQKIEALRPDVVTLDVKMPVMDGLTALRHIRKRWPLLPVIMFSTLTERGAATTIEALAAGASHYVLKPASVGVSPAAVTQVVEELVPIVKALGGRRRGPSQPVVLAAAPRTRQRPNVLTIASSTGGPPALEALLGSFVDPPDVPVLVVQHMPPMFTRLLAERLDALTPFRVVEAQGGDLLAPGVVYVAPGGRHLVVARRSDQGVIALLNDGPKENSCRPAADVLMRSVASVYRDRALGLVLTGMGQDGLAGAKAFVAAGSEVLVQDEASSVVWGMPGSVARAGLAADVAPLDALGTRVRARFAAAGELLGRRVR